MTVSLMMFQISAVQRQIEETLASIIAFLPNLVVAIIILIVGWLLGRFLGRVVAEVLDRIGVDDAVRKTSVGQYIEQTGTSIVRLMDLLVRWFIYLIAILAAIAVLQITVLTVLVANIAAYIPNVIAFILILVVGFILVDWLADFLHSYGRSQNIEFMGLFAMVLRAFLYFVVAILALEQLLIDLTIIYTFITPIAWGVGLGVGAAIAFFFFFGFRDRAPRMMGDLMSSMQHETEKVRQQEQKK
ncbi:MAG: hypothetical protein QMD46_08885 [Methanomicrobiales archaeon]|nr:hypothetical protein [Methanomicrobiales archaeon]